MLVSPSQSGLTNPRPELFVEINLMGTVLIFKSKDLSSSSYKKQMVQKCYFLSNIFIV